MKRSSDYKHSYYWYLTLIEYKQESCRVKKMELAFLLARKQFSKDHEIPPKLLVLDGTFLGGGWKIFDPVEILSFYKKKNTVKEADKKISYNEHSIKMCCPEESTSLIMNNNVG